MGGGMLAALVFILVAMNTLDFSPSVAAFAFSAGLLGFAGFFVGPAIADVFALLLHVIWGVANVSFMNWSVPTEDVPFRPISAAIFLIFVVAGTIALSIP
jgi:hypothetical protein